ncbi:hypothetical protein Ae168Ps1_2923c [Pseudonocardia sp. Ae168_Ps1]|nr:hypothetical protein Ae150APs1_2915c [Pseudonocardia sp. Ae150A_Ps1]OLL80517.1 hypothetical protein Ae168Ps1_2923c [Pseudonocardia sp. Ae168_Ps1]OLL85355.1 hypothetical protein Ae263Ps1_2410 [Pseudonocardia sp. Ae263_Ps1]OLL94618.1 hypothetical protein Ae356Ps1_4515c [Pseudonocardia sp. Ae356_Ps1]OLM21042.1 hypothetical protein Ae707Ps1_5301c [Pseudonocardia sp. Ae707_Ps1]
MVRRAGPLPHGTVVTMLDVLMNTAAVIGGVVLFLMLLTVAALPFLQEWGEQR